MSNIGLATRDYDDPIIGISDEKYFLTTNVHFCS